MASVVISPRAQLDIYDAWDYINHDNPFAADRWLDSIKERCATLTQHPRLGPARPDLGKDMRYFPMGSYVILYREDADMIDIVRVLHGARDLYAILHADEA